MNDTVPRYATYTYDHPNFLVNYPHRKRNKLVTEKIIAIGPASWLDYGAGDGALLSTFISKQALPDLVVCYEPVANMHSQLEDNVSKLDISAKSVKLAKTLADLEDSFDLVSALEVLEHLPLPERIKFYCFLASKLKRDGQVLIEIPVEYGPVLLLKECGRKFLKKRVSDYSPKELLNAAFFGKVADVQHRYLPQDNRTFIGAHRGFDLNRLFKELNSIGKIKGIMKSPFPFLPRIFNQTILFSFELKEWDAPKIQEAVISVNRIEK